MKTEWLHRNDNEWLIIFYTGWGMDAAPFRPLASDKYDILVFYNYSDEKCPINLNSLRQIYDRIYLVGWSMGVAHGQRDFRDAADHLYKSIAINGTLQPIDDLYGIPVDICRGTLESLDDDTLVKFYRRMCRSSSVLTKFVDNRPQRYIEDIKSELAVIMRNYQNSERERPIYTDIIISEKDMIIPTKNQIRFWQTSRAGNIRHLESSHFPFYLWKSWDEMVEFMS